VRDPSFKSLPPDPESPRPENKVIVVDSEEEDQEEEVLPAESPVEHSIFSVPVEDPNLLKIPFGDLLKNQINGVASCCMNPA